MLRLKKELNELRTAFKHKDSEYTTKENDLKTKVIQLMFILSRNNADGSKMSNVFIKGKSQPSVCTFGYARSCIGEFVGMFIFL